MKAAVVYGINDLRLEEIEKPQIERDDQILVKIKAVGICGSDIHILHGAIHLLLIRELWGMKWSEKWKQ